MLCLATVTLSISAPGPDPRGSAIGMLRYKTFTRDLRYAWLVRGPDAVDPKRTIRRLVLSSVDIGQKLSACERMSCIDGSVTEGMTVDFDAGPRLNYWVALDGQKTQYSGTAPIEAFRGQSNDHGRLAGRIGIDDEAAGGPKVSAEFDAKLLKEFHQ